MSEAFGEPQKLVLYGASGAGFEIACLVGAINAAVPLYDLLGFVDDAFDSLEESERVVGWLPILGSRQWLLDNKDDVVCCCTSEDPGLRASIYQELAAAGVRFTTLCSPDVTVAPRAAVGTGCVFYPGVSISCDCMVGDGVMLGKGCSLGYTSQVGDYAVLGMHTCVAPGVSVAPQTLVSHGEAVLKNR